MLRWLWLVCMVLEVHVVHPAPSLGFREDLLGADVGHHSGDSMMQGGNRQLASSATRNEDAVQVQDLFSWKMIDANSYTDLCAHPSDWVQNNVIAGVKAWNGTVYVTVPRWKRGVPATLLKVVTVDGVPKLSPFPSCAWQMLNSSLALQNVQSMEIDTHGRMWILDVGRTEIFEDVPVNVVPPKLVIYNLSSATPTMLRSYTFPPTVLDYEFNFLNDIVVDETNMVAYMTDTIGAGFEGGVVTYDYASNTARRFSGHSTRATPGYNCCVINGQHWNVDGQADGIALTPDTTRLYWSALSSASLWSAPTSVLRAFAHDEAAYVAQVEASVHLHGQKAGASDGMAFDAHGILYYGVLQQNALYSWDPKSGDALLPDTDELPGQVKLWADDTRMQWPDTLAFDEKTDTMLVTTNGLFKFFNASMEPDEINLRILRVRAPTALRSYLTAQPKPSRPPGARCHHWAALGVAGGFLLGLVVFGLTACACRACRKSSSLQAEANTGYEGVW